MATTCTHIHAHSHVVGKKKKEINQTKPDSCFFHPSHNKQRTHQLAVRFNTRFFLIGADEWQRLLVYPLTAVPIRLTAGLHSEACKTWHISPCILRTGPLSTKVWRASPLLALKLAAHNSALPATLYVRLLFFNVVFIVHDVPQILWL